jgi:hypothetical protein
MVGFKLWATAFIISGFGLSAVWAVEPAAGAAGAFLKLGVDARAAGLGGAYAAVPGDAASVYWNPAGLAAASRLEFRGTYTVLPGSGDYSQLIFMQPLSLFQYPADERAGSLDKGNWGVLAFSIIRLAAAYDMEARQVDSLNPNYLFSDIEGCYSVGWGLPLAAGWSLGVNLKGLYQDLDQTEASGWGVDAGVLYQGLEGVCLGLAVRDVYTRLDWKTGHKDYFPATCKGGASYTYRLLPEQTVMGSVDIEKNLTQEPWRLHAGVEYAWHEILFARGGMKDAFWTVGAGIRIPTVGWGRMSVQLEYAAIQDAIEGWDHWMTLGLKF